MDAYEESEMQKQLKKGASIAKPEFKQHFLAPIRTLDIENQVHLLRQCLDGNVSLLQLKKEAGLLKQLAMLKKKFVQLTNSGTWENSVILYPFHAQEKELKKFIALDFAKGIPKPFTDFCKRAKVSGSSSSQFNEQSDVYVREGDTYGYTIKENPCELSSSLITSIYNCFEGAHLAVVSIKPVSKIVITFHDLHNS